MGRYIIRRLLYGFLVLFGVITVVFVLFFFKPGDPARMMGGQHVSKEVLQAINQDLGLNLPFHKQYLLYLNDLSPVSVHNKENPKSYIYLEEGKYSHTELFGVGKEKVLVFKAPHLRRSYQSGKLVSEIITDRLPGTVLLASSSIILAMILGVILGVVAAINKGSFFDNSSLTFSVFGMSGPSFFTGLLIAYLFGELWSDVSSIPILPIAGLLIGLLSGFFAKFIFPTHRGGKILHFGRVMKFAFKGLGIGLAVWLLGVSINSISQGSPIPLLQHYFELPGTGLSPTGSMYEYEIGTGEYFAPKNLILPAFALGIRPLAIVVQLTRSSMLDVLSQDYIRTATAKGLSRQRVIIKHALKNALNPIVTAVSGWFASMMAGAIFIEYVFNWRGLGWKIFESIENDDLPVVMGSVLVFAIMFVLINIILDIVYGILDPRVRMK